MTPRAARLDDVPAVHALETAVFGADAWSSATCEAELLGAGRVALIAPGAQSEVDGYVTVLVAGDVADLTRIAVAPEARRRGVATALLRAATTALAATEADRMLLEVAEDNRAAIAFYARSGFAQIARRERYYRDGSAALVMERPLRPARQRPT